LDKDGSGNGNDGRQAGRALILDRKLKSAQIQHTKTVQTLQSRIAEMEKQNHYLGSRLDRMTASHEYACALEDQLDAMDALKADNARLMNENQELSRRLEV
jgi:hypothetical protein